MAEMYVKGCRMCMVMQSLGRQDDASASSPESKEPSELDVEA